MGGLMMRNDHTFEVFCCKNDGSEAVVGDEGPYLRRDLVALPAHHEALADCPEDVLKRSSGQVVLFYLSISSHTGSRSSSYCDMLPMFCRLPPAALPPR